MDGQVAVALRDDSIDYGQPKAASTAGIFGREEWLEHVGFDFFSQAGAGIENGQANVLSRFNVLWIGIARFFCDRGSFNNQRSPTRHRISCISDQICQHTLNLYRIGINNRGRFELQKQLNVSPDEPVYRIPLRLNQLVDIDLLGMQGAPATNGEQVLRQLSAL